MSTSRFAPVNGHSTQATMDAAASPNDRRKSSSAPSANGQNGAGKTSNGKSSNGPLANGAAASSGRDANGRFVKGNAGGPGNPFGRQVAALRQALLDAVTPEDIDAIALTLIEFAKGGDVQAAKLLLAYAIGKPAAASDPDQVDVQEWQCLKAEASMMSDLPDLVTQPGPDLPLRAVRGIRPLMSERRGAMISNLLLMGKRDADEVLHRLHTLPPDQAAAEMAKLARPRPSQDKAPSPNGKNGAPAKR